MRSVGVGHKPGDWVMNRSIPLQAATTGPSARPILHRIKPLLRFVKILLVAYLGLVLLVYFRQRSMLFFPSHHAQLEGLTRWSDGEQVIGCCREVPNPRTIWFMMHGNGGEAADRDYVLSCMSEEDSLYVLEYPGYGPRKGSPGMESMNRAAREAYRILRTQYPNTPICVLGESIGSGPACILAQEKVPPEKIVLVVPFDSLVRVASRHFPFLPVRLMLRDNWNNMEALARYRGPVEIFGALDDTIIPINHAQTLANRIRGAQFIAINGGHNDWSGRDQVRIKR
jgi:hypothetical protein